MKQCLIMQKIKEYNLYQFTGSKDWRFTPLAQLFAQDFRPHQLLNWLMNEEKTAEGNDWVDIRKEKKTIALYDISDGLDEEIYISIFPNQDKRFEMSVENFREILCAWETLRVSRPDIILIVIHEDNHVSLEVDPLIIKQYQDAGYAFDDNKK